MKTVFNVIGIIFLAVMLSGCPSIDETIYPFEVEMSEEICKDHMGWDRTDEYLFFVPRRTYDVYCNDGSVFKLGGSLGEGYDDKYKNVELISDNKELVKRVSEIAASSKD